MMSKCFVWQNYELDDETPHKPTTSSGANALYAHGFLTRKFVQAIFSLQPQEECYALWGRGFQNLALYAAKT